MSNSNVSNFESAFRIKTDEWIRNHALINHPWPKSGLFHYTKSDSVKKIIDSKTFHASFITSTSDPLEFTLPMAAIRDWVTTSGNLLDVNNENCPEMIEIFKFFNCESINPTLRPYFISLTAEKNNYLKNSYGDGCIKISKNIPEFPGFTYLIQVCYKTNIQDYIQNELSAWIQKIVFELSSSFSHEDVSKNFGRTFNFWMFTFILLSLTVKQKKFEYEQEYRLITFPGSPDNSARWHEPRVIKPSDYDSLGNIRPGSPRREYLPIKLSALGLKAQKVD